MDSVKAVFRRRDKIAAALVSALLSERRAVDPTSLSAAASAALDGLPKGCIYGAVYRTLQSLSASVPTAAELRRYAWAMAADVSRLRAGEPVVPGRLPVAADRVTVAVLAARSVTRFKTREQVARFRGQVLVGQGAPGTVEWTWSMKYANYIATHPQGLGLDRPRGAHTRPNKKVLPYHGYHALVGFRTTIEVRTEEGRVRVGSVLCPPNMRAFNRLLSATRDRDGFDCPFGYEHRCVRCPRGRDACPVACRSKDLLSALCAVCGKGFDLDPDWPTKNCFKCDHKKGGGR